jgi:hypothetical protein
MVRYHMGSTSAALIADTGIGLSSLVFVVVVCMYVCMHREYTCLTPRMSSRSEAPDHAAMPDLSLELIWPLTIHNIERERAELLTVKSGVSEFRIELVSSLELAHAGRSSGQDQVSLLFRQHSLEA